MHIGRALAMSGDPATGGLASSIVDFVRAMRSAPPKSMLYRERDAREASQAWGIVPGS